MSGGAAGNAGRCPICGKPVLVTHRPFCSKRCADVDLARWLGGAYRIQSNPADEDDEGLPQDIDPAPGGAIRRH